MLPADDFDTPARPLTRITPRFLHEQDNPRADLLDGYDPAYVRVLRASMDFRFAMTAYMRHAESVMGRMGLTSPQFHLLLAVKLDDDPVGPTIGKLADQFGLTHTAIVQTVNRLVEKGLLYRQDDPANGRMSRVIHTKAACAIMNRVSTTTISLIDGVSLSDKRRQMRAAMDALRDAETVFLARLQALGMDITP